MSCDNYPMAQRAENSELPAAKRFKKETATLVNSEGEPPIIVTQSHWRPESKIAVSSQIGNVTLVANDQKEFTIARSTAEFSETIKNMIEVVGTSNPIPFKDINSNQLSLVIEGLKKIEEIAQIQECNDKIIDLDRLFIGKSYDDVIEILKAVNYLDIPLLLEYINTLIVKQLRFSDITNVAALCTSLENNLPSELRLLIVGMMKKVYKEEIEQFLSKPVKTIMYNARYYDCVDMVSFAYEDKCVLIKMNETNNGRHQKKLYLFDIDTSNVVIQISGKGGYSYETQEEQVALNKKGTLCLAGRRKLCLWDLKTGKKISEYSGKKVPTLSIAISPDDTYALTGSKGGLVYLRKLFTGEIVKSLKGPNSEVKSMTFINDCKQALARFSDKTIMIWDLATGQVIKKYNLDDADIKAIDFSADGKKVLIVLHRSCTFYVLDLESDKKKELKINDNIHSIAISPDAKFALTAGQKICLWNLETGKIMQEFNYKKSDKKTLVSFSSDGKLALLGTNEAAYVFDLSIANQLTLSQLTLFIRLNQSKTLNCPYFKSVYDGLSPDLKHMIWATT